MSLPISQLLNVITVAFALMFSGYFVTDRFRKHKENGFLVAVFLIMVAIKIDQIYQMMGGLRTLVSYGFVLTPVQWLMTPALYFFLLFKTGLRTSLCARDAWHLIPFALVTAYYAINFYWLPVNEKLALLDSGWLRHPFNNVLLPLTGDVLQLAYLAAAYGVIRQHGIRVRNWFADIEKHELRTFRRMLTLWVIIFILHLLFVVARTAVGQPPFLFVVLMAMNILHLAITIALATSAISDYFEIERGSLPPKVLGAAPKTQLDQAEREAHFQRLVQAMSDDQAYKANDLNLAKLADQLAMTPRELSEVINREADKNFFEFINGYRVEHAKHLLSSQPDLKIIDLAFECGFNSKSAFNEAFKRSTSQSPSQYRAQNQL